MQQIAMHISAISYFTLESAIQACQLVYTHAPPPSYPSTIPQPNQSEIPSLVSTNHQINQKATRKIDEKKGTGTHTCLIEAEI